MCRVNLFCSYTSRKVKSRNKYDKFIKFTTESWKETIKLSSFLSPFYVMNDISKYHSR